MEEKGVFRAFLEEYYRKPTVDLVQFRRNRFSSLLQAVAKSLFRNNHDKAWRLSAYMIMLLEQAEYPDEFVTYPLDEVFMYLHVIYASCGAELGRNVDGCITIANRYMKNSKVYPVLYSTLVLCYMKQGEFNCAALVISNGIDNILAHGKHVVDKTHKLALCSLEYVQSLGFNSPSYIMFLFYVYGKLLHMDIDEEVESFMIHNGLKKEFEFIKKSVERNTYQCCISSTVVLLNQLKYIITLQNLCELPNYDDFKAELLVATDEPQHANHCSVKSIAVNDNTTTNRLVHKLSDLDKELCPVQPTIKSEASADFDAKTLSLPSNCISAKVVYKIKSVIQFQNRYRPKKIGWPVGKPYRTKFFRLANKQKCLYKKRNVQGLQSKALKQLYHNKVLPKLTIIVRDARVHIIERLYWESIKSKVNACQLFAGLDNILTRIVYIYNECAIPLARGTANQIWSYAEHIMEGIRICVIELKSYVERFEKFFNIQIVTMLYTLLMKRTEELSLVLKVHLRRYSFGICKSVARMMNFPRSTATLFSRTTIDMIAMYDMFRRADIVPSSKDLEEAFSICRTCFFGCYHMLLRGRNRITDYMRMCYGHPPPLAIQQKTTKSHGNKETQTKYSKFSCSSKQTQTDKRLSEEHALKKQLQSLSTCLNDKNNRICELEDRLFELSEAKKDVLENQNRIIKALRKELGEAHRTIQERDKEVEQQKNEIERLKEDLSKLSKPYSDAVKTSEEMQSEQLRLQTQNEKLKTSNASLITENNNLHKHLGDLTEEYDKVKSNCDKSHKVKEEIEILFKKKAREHEDIINKFKTYKVEQYEKAKRDQNRIAEISSIIQSTVKDFVDVLLEKLTQYKVRCTRVHQELYCLFYNSTSNISSKQTFEVNQLFLLTLIRQLERNLHLLMTFKVKISEDGFANLITLTSTINWKSLLSYAEEFCTHIFTQYVENLNFLMTIHTAITDNAHYMNANSIPEQDNLYRQSLPIVNNLSQQFDMARDGFVNCKTPKVNPGPVGSNRPQSFNTEHRKAKAQTNEIEDPNTKNILSQIANAVNYPSSMSPTYNLDPNQGVIRRPVTARKMPDVEGTATPENYYWGQNMPIPSSTPLDCSDFNTYNGKFRDIFLTVQKRFPTALMGDLIDSLNYIKHTHNTNLHKVPLDTIVESVSNYIARQSKNRGMRAFESCEVVKSDNDDICSICFDNFTMLPTCTLKCGHMFHTKCIRLWTNQNNVCPICRKFTILDFNYPKMI